jgi:hypothetical protein
MIKTITILTFLFLIPLSTMADENLFQGTYLCEEKQSTGLKSMQKTTFEGNFEMNCFPHPLFILNKFY